MYQGLQRENGTSSSKYKVKNRQFDSRQFDQQRCVWKKSFSHKPNSRIDAPDGIQKKTDWNEEKNISHSYEWGLKKSRWNLIIIKAGAQLITLSKGDPDI